VPRVLVELPHRPRGADRPDRGRLAKLLPLSWYDVLLALYEAPEHKLRTHELVSAILVTRGGLTRLVGLVEAHCYCRSSASRSIPRGVGF
jgi:hypothetical protein